jgi:hypothetical protein
MRGLLPQSLFLSRQPPVTRLSLLKGPAMKGLIEK